jgi:hypothetical protein
MRRVFAVDVLEVIIAFLASLGLPTRAPPLEPVREVDPGEADPGEADPGEADLLLS